MDSRRRLSVRLQKNITEQSPGYLQRANAQPNARQIVNKAAAHGQQMPPQKSLFWQTRLKRPL